MLTCNGLELAQGAFCLTADISFTKGAVTAVIGPSGAGKSTLLSAIAGFVTPRTGEVSFDGKDFTDMSPGKRPVSILFQDNNLFPHLSVRDNVGMGLRLNRKLNGSEQRAVSDVLGQVGLESDQIDRKPALLSGGQQSRAGLARLLLSEQPIVLLDEPFSALGPGLKDEMLDLMKSTLLWDGTCTVLMVTHDPADAKRIADQVVWVEGGIAHSPRATSEIFADPPKELSQYLGAMG